MGSAAAISIDFNAEVAKFVTASDNVGRKLDGLGGKFAHINEAGSHLFENIVGAELVSGAIERVADASVEAARKMADLVAETIAQDAAAIRMAQSMDMSVGALQGLQSAAKVGAGIDAESFTRGFEHMAGVLNDAALKAGPARDSFERLGLTARNLAGDGLDKTFLSVADGLSKIENASTRIKVAEDIFGARQAKELLPLLTQGADKINEYVESAKRAGVVMSQIDAAKVMQASKAAIELHEKFDGIVQQLTISLAPAITAIVKEIESLIPDAGRLQAGFGAAMDEVVADMAAVIDVIHQAHIELLRFESFAKQARVNGTMKVAADLERDMPNVAEALNRMAGNPADDAQQKLQRAKEELVDLDEQIKKLQDTPSFAPKLIAGWEKFKKTANDAAAAQAKIDDAKPHAAIDTTFELEAALKKLTIEASTAAESLGMDDVSKKIHALTKEYGEIPASLQPAVDKLKDMSLQTSVMQMTMEAKKNVDTFGMSDLQKKIYDLKQQFGGIPASIQPAIDRLKEMTRQVDAMEKQKKDMEDIKRLAEEGETPFQRWSTELEKANRLLAEHKISSEQFERAKKKIDEDYRKSNEGHGGQVAAAARRFDFQMPGNHLTSDPAMDIRRKQLEEQKKASKGLDDIRDNTKKMNDALGGVVSNLA